MGKYSLPVPENNIAFCRPDYSSSPVRPLKVYLELPLDGDPPALSLRFRSQIDMYPMRVWYGVVRWYEFAPEIDAIQFAEYVNNGKLDSIIDRIIAGSSIVTNERSGNQEGRLTDDAKDAEDDLQAILSDYSEGSMYIGDARGIWEAWDWWSDKGTRRDLGITATTTDEEIAALVKHETEKALSEGVVLIFADELFRGIRLNAQVELQLENE
jgi:hypothetical protein